MVYAALGLGASTVVFGCTLVDILAAVIPDETMLTAEFRAVIAGS
jgi:hypothetical protein